MNDRAEPASKESAVAPQRAAALAPFRCPLFTMIWIATIVANIGTWMYSAAAGWLMTDLNPNPLMVSLVQSVSNLPLLLFALPAGALADLIDLRWLIRVLEIATTIVSAIFAVLVSFRLVDPVILLVFVFLIGALAALEAPAWQSVVPQLVSRDDLGAAIAANSIGINISRAIGPALGGVLIGLAGIALPFWLNAVSNLGVIAAFFLWRSCTKEHGGLPAERYFSAIRAGLRYARNNGALKATFARSIGFFLFASSYWALLPNLARYQIGGGPQLYGVMLGAIGAGAVLSAVFLPRLNKWLSPDRVVDLGQVVTALALVVLGLARNPAVGIAGCLLAGMAWIAVLASLNVAAQVALPDWVRGRGLALYVTIFFGTMTAGSLIWGEVASLRGLPLAHFIAAAGGIAAVPLLHGWKLQAAAGFDLTPSAHWPSPVMATEIPNDAGPVMVTVEYDVSPQNREAFAEAIYEYSRERKRDGAYAWGIFMDTANENRYIETFLVDSWVEHLRQHERVTKADRVLEQAVRALVRGEPITTHAIHLEPPETRRDAPG
ncbi:MAG TPA: MFS transporter [Micropepsaceae bacterium]|nr:MFS transporter [Micropepsaceae bacterium]